MRRWEAWEKETQTVEYQVANGERYFPLATFLFIAIQFKHHGNYFLVLPLATQDLDLESIQLLLGGNFIISELLIFHLDKNTL